MWYKIINLLQQVILTVQRAVHSLSNVAYVLWSAFSKPISLWVSSSKRSLYGENFIKMLTSPTLPFTSFNILHCPGVVFTLRFKEWLWQWAANALGSISIIFAATPDFFPIMLEAPSYVWPRHLKVGIWKQSKGSLIASTMVSDLILFTA